MLSRLNFISYFTPSLFSFPPILFLCVCVCFFVLFCFFSVVQGVGRGIRLLGWLVYFGENADFNLELQIILLKPLCRPPVFISSKVDEEDRNVLPA